MRLTEIGIRSLKAPESGVVLHHDDTIPGFAVRVSQAGTKSFCLTMGRNRQRVTIGRVGVISLADARKRAREMLAERTLGYTRPKSVTFDAALTRFLSEHYRNLKPSTQKEAKRHLERHFLPGFRNMPLADITDEDIARRLAKMDHTPGEQLHSYRVLRTFLRWCVKRRYLIHNPIDALSRPSQDVVRDRVLTDDEIRAVWHAATGSIGSIVKLLYLTAQRRTQIGSLEWVWISDTSITWPAAMMKGGREFVLPVTPMIRAILEAVPRLHDTYVFPARDRDTPYSGYSKGKRGLDRAAGVTDWRIHDLRRSAATRIASHTQPHILQVLLSHSTGPISALQAIYNKWDYYEDKKAALDRHEAHLQQMLNS